MATFYINSTAPGPGVPDDPNNPYPTYTLAEAAASAGDTLIFQQAAYDAAGDNSGFIFTRKGVLVTCANPRGTVLTAPDPTFVISASSQLLTTDRPRWEQFIIDGEDSTLRGHQLINNDTSPPEVDYVRNVLSCNCTQYCFYNAREQNTQEYIDCEIAGDVTYGWGTPSGETGTVGQQQINIRNAVARGITLLTSVSALVFVERDTGAGFDVGALVDNLRGDVTYEGLTGTLKAINLIGVTAPVVRGLDLELTSASANSSHGVFINGSSAHTTEEAVVTDGVITFDATAGHAVKFGDDAEPYCTGGGINGMHVTGTPIAGATPHGLSMSEGTDGLISGSTIRRFYAGMLLASGSAPGAATTTPRGVGNLLFDNYGPSIYCKGTDPGTEAKNNIVVVSTDALQEDLGVLSVTYQGTNDCAGADIEANTVIVQDPIGNIARGGRLAAITRRLVDGDQVCTFTRNLYYIPDTIDISTAELFALNNLPVTFATWLADPRVTDDRIIQLPQADIDRLVQEYRVQAEPPGVGTIGGIRRPIRASAAVKK